MGNTIGEARGESSTIMPGDTAARSGNPPIKPTPAEKGFWSRWGGKILDGTQVALDVVGLVPGVGEVADLANAGISAARGDYVGAGLSLAAAVPFAGWTATGAKVLRKGAQAADAVNDAKKAEAIGEGALKAGDDVAEQAGKHADDAAEQTGKHGDDAAKQGDDAADQTKQDSGEKSKGKSKPDCGQIGVYKQKRKFDNSGTNWDHVPSGRALEQAAENKLRGMLDNKGRSMWDKLSDKERNKVLNAARNDAYTINIPEGVHADASPTFKSKNKPLYPGDARDKDSLKKAMERDMEAIERHMQDSDHPCRKQYSAARRAMSRVDPDRHLDAIIKKTLDGL